MFEDCVCDSVCRDTCNRSPLSPGRRHGGDESIACMSIILLYMLFIHSLVHCSSRAFWFEAFTLYGGSVVMGVILFSVDCFFFLLSVAKHWLHSDL